MTEPDRIDIAIVVTDSKGAKSKVTIKGCKVTNILAPSMIKKNLWNECVAALVMEHLNINYR